MIHFRTFILLLTAFFLSLGYPDHAQSQGKKQGSGFELLRESFFRLRNTDVDRQKYDQWIDLATRLRSYADKNRKHKEAPFALLFASVLHLELAEKYPDSEKITMALAALHDLTERYPLHPLADDALLRQGDINRVTLNNEPRAQEFYSRVVAQYADSDMASVARDRLLTKDSSVARKALQLPSMAGKFIVLLDPGHGGEDLGAVGTGGLLEKDVALDVAFRLEELLEAEPGIAVRLTRKTDVFVPLAQRTALANNLEADIFVSLHANASISKSHRGVQTFYLDNQGGEASRKLAERENASVRFEGPAGDLQFMLSDLIQNAKQSDSISLAHEIQNGVFKKISSQWKGLRNLGVHKAPFYVLVGAHMPCVLVELSFIDQSEEGARLASPEYRKSLAEGVFNGIRNYRRGLK